jgi:acyl-CoA thioesterase
MMNPRIKEAIATAVVTEPYPRAMGMELCRLEDGQSRVEMVYDPSRHNNIYGRAHGGAVFGLIDEAFETASQTDGTIAVAMNVNVTYIRSPEPGTRLCAEARRIAETKRTATYDISVTDGNNGLIAVCQALAYRTGKPIPFL